MPIAASRNSRQPQGGGEQAEEQTDGRAGVAAQRDGAGEAAERHEDGERDDPNPGP